jgi:hypothetical protein
VTIPPEELPDDMEGIVPETVDHEAADAALLLSFGAVIPGREALAVKSFTEVGRALGRLMDAGTISSFRPYFYADGLAGDVSGFFLLHGRRDRLDQLRRDEAFTALVLRVGGAVANVRLQTLVAGSAAGRMVNLYREVRRELGLL